MTRARYPSLTSLGMGVRRFFQLPSADRHLLMRAVCGLAVVKVALRCLPLRVTRRALARVGQLRARPRLRHRAVERSVWAVTTASGLVPGGGNCLVRALTLQTLLAGYGVAAELHIGFARNACAKVEGHAWLTCKGHVLIGDLADLARFERSARATKAGR